MDPDIETLDEDWNGVEQREARRRYTVDRRLAERRKRYWWSMILPIILGTGLAGLLSWGVYVTHVTYRISANYELSFVKHLERQVEKEFRLDHRLEVMKADFTNRTNLIRSDMTAGLKEIRDMQTTMYKILVQHERQRNRNSLYEPYAPGKLDTHD
jgi:hypothetical protein